MSIQATMNPRIELANRLVGGAQAPEAAIKSLFQGIIFGIETRMNTPFSEETKIHVWNQIKTDKVALLKTTLIEEVASKILQCFTEDEIETMLTEHRQQSMIHNSELSTRLQRRYALQYPKIIDRLCTQASEMKHSLVTSVYEALKIIE